MTRPLILLASALVLPALAGCLDDTPMGMIRVHVKDTPADVVFESLTTSVDRIVLTMMDGMRMEEEVTGASFDLAKLTEGATVTVYDGDMMAGDYKRIDIYLTEGQGTLQGGAPVTVIAPNGRVYVDKDFTVPEDGMSEFVFDVQVEDLGNGQYRFVANLDGSGPDAPDDSMMM